MRLTANATHALAMLCMQPRCSCAEIPRALAWLGLMSLEGKPLNSAKSKPELKQAIGTRMLRQHGDVRQLVLCSACHCNGKVSIGELIRPGHVNQGRSDRPRS